MNQTWSTSESESEESAAEASSVEFHRHIPGLDPNGPKGQPRVIANFSKLAAAYCDLDAVTAADAVVTTLHMHRPETLDEFLSRSNKHVKWECCDKGKLVSLLIIRNLRTVEVSQQG